MGVGGLKPVADSDTEDMTCYISLSGGPLSATVQTDDGIRALSNNVT